MEVVDSSNPDANEDASSDSDMSNVEMGVFEKRAVRGRIDRLKVVAGGYFITTQQYYPTPSALDFVQNLALFRHGDEWMERVEIGPSSTQIAPVGFEDGAIVARTDPETQTRKVEYFKLSEGEFDLEAELSDASQLGEIYSILPFDSGPVLVTKESFVVLRRGLLGLEATNRIDRSEVMAERYTANLGPNRHIIEDSIVYENYFERGRSRLVAWDLNDPETVWKGESEWTEGLSLTMVMSNDGRVITASAPNVYFFSSGHNPTLLRTWDLSNVVSGETASLKVAVLDDWLLVGFVDNSEGISLINVYDLSAQDPVCLGTLSNNDLEGASWPTVIDDRFYALHDARLEPPLWNVKGYKREELQLSECE